MFVFIYKNNTLKNNYFEFEKFSSYLPVQFVKCLFTNIHKQ